ncbi:MAG: hypothetical protein VKN72_13190 [Nostocales cyanobacterium 94392]|nr:hypothetical protein [Nostocales cyanobacterium 94392]
MISILDFGFWGHCDSGGFPFRRKCRGFYPHFSQTRRKLEVVVSSGKINPSLNAYHLLVRNPGLGFAT